MLEKFTEMKLSDAKRAFIIYCNFIKINKEIRKMASSIIQEFNIKISISFYDIDTKVIEALKVAIDLKEKESNPASSCTSLLSGSGLSAAGCGGKKGLSRGVSNASSLSNEGIMKDLAVVSALQQEMLVEAL